MDAPYGAVTVLVSDISGSGQVTGVNTLYTPDEDGDFLLFAEMTAGTGLALTWHDPANNLQSVSINTTLTLTPLRIKSGSAFYYDISGTGSWAFHLKLLRL